MKGDLDVIAMKSIEKDRTRRYDTASALADDVQTVPQRRADRRAVSVACVPIHQADPSLSRGGGDVTCCHGVTDLRHCCHGPRPARSSNRREHLEREATQKANRNLESALLDLKDTLFFEGYAKLFAGDIEQAGDIVDRLREIGAHDLADKLHGALLVYSGRGPEAVQFLEEKVEKSPSSVGLLALLRLRVCTLRVIMRTTSALWPGWRSWGNPRRQKIISLQSKLPWIYVADWNMRRQPSSIGGRRLLCSSAGESRPTMR